MTVNLHYMEGTVSLIIEYSLISEIYTGKIKVTCKHQLELDLIREYLGEVFGTPPSDILIDAIYFYE